MLDEDDGACGTGAKARVGGPAFSILEVLVKISR